MKKTIYVNGKNKDLVIKRLGSEKYICETYGGTDAKAWAKEQIWPMNEAEKADSVKFNIELCSSTDLVLNDQRRFNGGLGSSNSPTHSPIFPQFRYQITIISDKFQFTSQN